MEMVTLTGVPVDNEYNRNTARFMGLAEIEWPRCYEDSVPGNCSCCKGDIMIGPAMMTHREYLRFSGHSGEVFCLFCAAFLFRKSHRVVTLTDKETG